jgi:hypothetical protein
MNLPVLIIVGVAAVALILFLVIRNQKDKKDLEYQIKNDYPKSKDEEGDADIDNPPQIH